MTTNPMRIHLLVKKRGTCKEVDNGDIVCGLAIYANEYCKKHYSKQYKQHPKGTCKEVGFDGNICKLAAISNIGCCSIHYDKRYCTHMITLKPPFWKWKRTDPVYTACYQRRLVQRSWSFEGSMQCRRMSKDGTSCIQFNKIVQTAL
jgi:hypothetical protein